MSEPDRASGVARLGYEIREAVESGDLVRAAQLRIERDEASSGSSLASPIPPGLPPQSLLDELEIAADRRHELLVAVLIGDILGDARRQTGGVLAAVAGMPLGLPQLEGESHLFRQANFAPYMWSPLLLQQPTCPPVEANLKSVRSLSPDSRALLTLNGAIQQRRTASREALSERALLRPARLQAALDELSARGLAIEQPSVDDRLALANISQLAELKAAHRLKGARKKDDSIRLVVESVPEATIWGWMQRTNPAWIGDDIVAIGLDDKSGAIGWYEAFATLFAHTLQMQLYAHREVLQAQSMHLPGWQVLKTDDCPICREAPTRLSVSDQWRLPPFHLGCRCAVAGLPPT